MCVCGRGVGGMVVDCVVGGVSEARADAREAGGKGFGERHLFFLWHVCVCMSDVRHVLEEYLYVLFCVAMFCVRAFIAYLFLVGLCCGRGVWWRLLIATCQRWCRWWVRL